MIKQFSFLSFSLTSYTVQRQRRENEDMELARKLHEQEAKRTQSKQSPHHQADEVSDIQVPGAWRHLCSFQGEGNNYTVLTNNKLLKKWCRCA